ncbi:MAG: sugar porter family MFS transporter [bacterium]|nr:sugar porter family MFS transporter [bacterium]
MKNKNLYLVAFFVALGGLLSGFDTGVISGALLYINNEWHLSEFMQGFLVSTVLMGAALGAVLNGRLADVYGRKKIIFITAIIFFAGSILCAVSPNVYLLMISRFIVGFAIGIITFCAPLYLSEISPEKIRGALVSMFQLAITMGILFSYLSNAFFASFCESWRLMLLIGIFPAALLATGIYFMPDTPRWYVLKGRFEEASNVLSKLQPEADVKTEIENIKSLIFTENKKGKFRFKKWMLLPLVIGVGGMFVQQWTGINTIIYYAPTILQQAGFSDNLGAICATIGIGVVNFLMTFVAIFSTDKIGRKPLLYIGLTGMGICLFLLAASFKYALLLGDNAKYFALLSTILYIMFFAMSLGPVMILLVSEVFPLRIRGVMMSISMMSNFVFNFSVSLSFLPMLKHFGEFNTFMLFSVLSFLSIIFVRFVIPETKGVTLETIERNWIKNV